MATRDLLAPAILSILSGGSVLAFVQLVLLRRTGAKLRAEADSVMVGSAERMVKILDAEREKLHARAEHAETIVVDAMVIIRELLHLIRRRNGLHGGQDQDELRDLELRALELEHRRRPNFPAPRAGPGE